MVDFQVAEVRIGWLTEVLLSISKWTEGVEIMQEPSQGSLHIVSPKWGNTPNYTLQQNQFNRIKSTMRNNCSINILQK